MPIITNFEDKVLQLIRSNQYQWFTVGVNLGGVSGEAGGSGVPLGGFVGQLIQSKVTFDTSEVTSLDIPSSGVSLIHNLNRIRYWINQKNPALIVQDEGVEVASGVTTMDFVGAPVEVTLSGGKVIVTVSGTGGGGGEVVKVSSDDTVANYLDDKVTVVLPITKTVNNPGGNEDLELGFDGDLDDLSDVSIITAVSGEVLAYTDTWLNLTLAEAGISEIGHTHVESDVTDLDHDAVKIQGTDVSSDSPTNHDILAYSSGGEWVPSGVPAGGAIDVQEDDTPKVSDVTVLNFEGGATVTDEGGGKATILISGGTGSDDKDVKVSSDDTTAGYLEDKIVEGTDITITVLNPGGNETLEITSTASGGGSGGGDIAIGDEGIVLTSGVTSLDFVGDQITATNDGDDVTITFSGIVVTPPPFIGCKTYLTSSTQLTTTNGWQSVDWDAEEYDTDTMWAAGAGHNINTTGYYNMIGQMTFSGALPTTERVQIGLFKGNDLINEHIDGYFTNASGIYTMTAQTDIYATDTEYLRIQMVVADSAQPYVLSGVANSFLATHQITGVFVEGATPEICKVKYTSYLNVPDNTDTVIPWSTEIFDTASMWASSPNSSRFTIPSNGYYSIKSTLSWETIYYQGGTPFAIKHGIVKNGSTDITSHWDWCAVDTGGDRSVAYSTHAVSDVYLEADDYVETYVWHYKGAIANGLIRGGDGTCYSSIQRLG